MKAAKVYSVLCVTAACLCIALFSGASGEAQDDQSSSTERGEGFSLKMHGLRAYIIDALKKNGIACDPPKYSLGISWCYLIDGIIYVAAGRSATTPDGEFLTEETLHVFLELDQSLVREICESSSALSAPRVLSLATSSSYQEGARYSWSKHFAGEPSQLLTTLTEYSSGISMPYGQVHGPVSSVEGAWKCTGRTRRGGFAFVRSDELHIVTVDGTVRRITGFDKAYPKRYYDWKWEESEPEKREYSDLELGFDISQWHLMGDGTTLLVFAVQRNSGREGIVSEAEVEWLDDKGCDTLSVLVFRVNENNEVEFVSGRPVGINRTSITGINRDYTNVIRILGEAKGTVFFYAENQVIYSATVVENKVALNELIVAGQQQLTKVGKRWMEIPDPGATAPIDPALPEIGDGDISDYLGASRRAHLLPAEDNVPLLGKIPSVLSFSLNPGDLEYKGYPAAAVDISLGNDVPRIRAAMPVSLRQGKSEDPTHDLIVFERWLYPVAISKGEAATHTLSHGYEPSGRRAFYADPHGQIVFFLKERVSGVTRELRSIPLDWSPSEDHPALRDFQTADLVGIWREVGAESEDVTYTMLTLQGQIFEMSISSAVLK